MDFEIEFQNVSFTYHDGKTPALVDINLHVAAGEIVLITGPAGSGKTTFCSAINGLVPHYHEGQLTGKVLVQGHDTRRSRIGGLASLVGLVFQDPESQLVTASVADEVAFGPENLGVPASEINMRVGTALKATRLEGFNERDPHTLSGGEQQACAIAAIYSMHPDIYVMDEPTANLDPLGTKQVLKVVVELAKQRGKTLIIVEHALEAVLPLVQRLIIMDHGRIVRDGAVQDVLASGEMPGVFTRPALVRLADEIDIHPYPLDPDAFYNALHARHRLRNINFHIPAVPTPTHQRNPVIEISDVEYAYDGQEAALQGISVTIYQGDMIALMGRNGSGKTTLARHIIGLLQPNSGQVTVMDHDVARTPTFELARLVGYCFQNPNHQIVSFDVRNEMLFGLKAHNFDPSEYDKRIRSALEFVGMSDYLDSDVFSLGRGQRQRLALASVLALSPPILVIDEPTTGQDPQMTTEIFEIVKRLNDGGTTIIMITHEFGQAALYANRAVVLQQGRIVYDGAFRRLLLDDALLTANSLDLPDITKLSIRLSEYGVTPGLVNFRQVEAAIKLLVEDSDGH